MVASIACLSSCAMFDRPSRDLSNADSGLPREYWPALPLAEKMFIFSTDTGKLVDIVYLELPFRDGKMSQAHHRLALHGGTFISAPFTGSGPSALPTSVQAAAAAASSPQAASAATSVSTQNADTSQLLLDVKPVEGVRGDAGQSLLSQRPSSFGSPIAFQVSASREAGDSSWKYSKTIPVAELALLKPEILGLAKLDSLAVMDVFGSLPALDAMKEPQARAEIGQLGIKLPDEKPMERKTDEKKAAPDPEKGFFQSLFSFSRSP